MRRRRPNDNTERAPSFLQSVDTEQTPDIARFFGDVTTPHIPERHSFCPHHPAHFFVKPLSMGCRRAWQQAAVFCIRTSAHNRTSSVFCFCTRHLLLCRSEGRSPTKKQKLPGPGPRKRDLLLTPLQAVTQQSKIESTRAVIHGSSTQLSSEWWLHTHTCFKRIAIFTLRPPPCEA